MEGKSGLTPLHCSVLRDHARVARALLRAGADPMAKTGALETPYRMAMVTHLGAVKGARWDFFFFF